MSAKERRPVGGEVHEGAVTVEQRHALDAFGTEGDVNFMAVLANVESDRRYADLGRVLVAVQQRFRANVSTVALSSRRKRSSVSRTWRSRSSAASPRYGRRSATAGMWSLCTSPKAVRVAKARAWWKSSFSRCRRCVRGALRGRLSVGGRICSAMVAIVECDVSRRGL
jgi:hypothetical protein